MGFGFLNALMLLGLAGVALPILAHLLSKRKFDVVQWGAMRFLELGQKTRRRFRIQDLLLLLLRMALLAILALALARPWGSAAFFSSLIPRPQADFVFILDGSGSMGQQGGLGDGEDTATRTPYRDAVQWLHDSMESLHPGDTVSVIDARNQSRRIVSAPTTDFRQVRRALEHRPEPQGTSSLPEAIEEALRVLSTATNVTRNVVILTDRQALAWRPEDESAWTRVSELQKQAAVPPEIAVVFFGEMESSPTNYSVGPIELSRSITVAGFPIKLRAKIRQSGGRGVEQRTVSLVVNEKKVPGAEKMADILPDSESAVEFEQTFPSTGHYVVSIAIEEPDQLPVDNRSLAVVSITESIPVLLVDGDRHPDLARQESFYLQSAFAAVEDQAPWVDARVIRPFELNADTLRGQEIVFLCNVERVTERQLELLKSFVRDGGALIVAPGDRIDQDFWNPGPTSTEAVFLPSVMREVADGSSAEGTEPVRIDTTSLEAPWLRRFRNEEGGDLTTARFLKWWRLEPTPVPSADSADPSEFPNSGPIQIQARLTSGDSLLVRHRYGHGEVVQLAVPLDADWSTLPAKNDFVPFLYELVFTLTGDLQRRNLQVGEPLLLPLSLDEAASEYVVNGPGIINAAVASVSRGQSILAKFDETWMPGVYRFTKKGVPAEQGEPFVVDDDHSESKLTLLTPDEWNTLQEEHDLRTRATMAEVVSSSLTNSGRVELWWILMLLVLAVLCCETALTRRMVQGGHAAIETPPQPDSTSSGS